MEILKPKWVDNVEYKRNLVLSSEISSSAVLPVILKHTVEVFLKQLPTLITSFTYFQKAVFKKPLYPLDVDSVNERFFTDAAVIATERATLLAMNKTEIAKKGTQLSLQIAR
jgi:hypothetical protein